MKGWFKQLLVGIVTLAVVTFLFVNVGGGGVYVWGLFASAIALFCFAVFTSLRLDRTAREARDLREAQEVRIVGLTADLATEIAALKERDIENYALLHSMPDSIWRTDRNGNFIDVITAKGQKPLVADNGWLGKAIYDVLPPSVAQKVMRAAEAAIETDESQILDFLSSDEENIHHYESRVVWGHEAGILIFLRDITEFKQAEAKTQVILETIQGVSTTSNLKELLDHIYYSISRFLYTENCFVALFNAKTQMLDMQYFVDRYDIVPPEVKLGRSLAGYVFRIGEPMLLTSTAIRQLIDDGEVEVAGMPPAVWLGVPLRTPKGVIGVFVVQHYEDTNAYDRRDLELLTSIGDQIAVAIDRKRAENEMFEAKSFLNRVIDNVPNLIYVKDRMRRYVLTNKAFAALHGLDVKDVIGKTDEDLVGLTEDVERYIQSDRDVIENNREFINQEEKVVDYNGDTHWLQSIKRPLVGTAGVEYILGIATDLTEWKNLENRLRHAQKLESIGQLAAGIAHEINTPTQYVGDNVRFLKDSFQDYSTVVAKTGTLIDLCRSRSLEPEFVSEIAAAIEAADMEYLQSEVPKAFSQALDGVERISKIVQSMKDFAHPGSNDKRAADLNKAIESTVTVASNEWKYVADVVTDYDPALPPIPCLIGELNQVILNMIVNAAHAIKDVIGSSGVKGQITIGTRRKGDWVEIRVSDTGTGMPDSVIKKIFDPFFTTKDVGKGSGQGLAISHNVIVDKHQGTIDVASEVGMGTTFVILLPLTAESEGKHPSIEKGVPIIREINPVFTS